jgi:hypothetical protein
MLLPLLFSDPDVSPVTLFFVHTIFRTLLLPEWLMAYRFFYAQNPQAPVVNEVPLSDDATVAGSLAQIAAVFEIPDPDIRRIVLLANGQVLNEATQFSSLATAQLDRGIELLLWSAPDLPEPGKADSVIPAPE